MKHKAVAVSVLSLALLFIVLFIGCGQSKANSVKQYLKSGDVKKIQDLITSQKDQSGLAEIATALIQTQQDRDAIICLIYLLDNKPLGLDGNAGLKSEAIKTIVTHSGIQEANTWASQKIKDAADEAKRFNASRQKGEVSPGIGDEPMTCAIIANWNNTPGEYELVSIYSAAKTEALKAAVVARIQKAGTYDRYFAVLCEHQDAFSIEFAVAFGKPAAEYIAKYAKGGTAWSYAMSQLSRGALYVYSRDILQEMLTGSNKNLSERALRSLSNSDNAAATATVTAYVDALPKIEDKQRAIQLLDHNVALVPYFEKLLADPNALMRYLAFDQLLESDSGNTAKYAKTYLANKANLNFLFNAQLPLDLTPNPDKNTILISVLPVKGVLYYAITNGTDEVKNLLLNVVSNQAMTTLRKIELLDAMTDKWTDKDITGLTAKVCKTVANEKISVRFEAIKLLFKVGEATIAEVAQFFGAGDATVRVNAALFVWKHGKTDDIQLWYEKIRLLAGDYQALIAHFSDLGPDFFKLLLEQYGNKAMAEGYLNSNIDALEKMAETWAKDHGYKIVPGVPYFN